MTTTRVGSRAADSMDESPGDEASSLDKPSSPEADDPLEPPPAVERTALVVHASPCTVWFGPRGPESVERELAAFLGSHNGVAVLQWPRDTNRAAHFADLGIPCLWLVRDPDDTPPMQSALQEWLPHSASDDEVHDCLERLSEHGAARRQAASLELDGDGWLHLGDSGVHLAPTAERLATLLIDHFDEAVDDAMLSEGSESASTSRWNNSLSSDLMRLDRYVNPLGLEVIPVPEHAHLIRRCRH
jgi:hypothetical protein